MLACCSFEVSPAAGHEARGPVSVFAVRGEDNTITLKLEDANGTPVGAGEALRRGIDPNVVAHHARKAIETRCGEAVSDPAVMMTCAGE